MKQNSFINQVTVLRPELERIAAQMYEGDAERAEDAVSELLIKLWQMRDSLDEVKSIRAYCHTALRHIVIDDLRNKRTERLDEEGMEYKMTAPQTWTEAEQYELSELLQKAVAQLPTLRRQVYELHELQGYECNEIAELLNLRIDAIHNHLSRARKQMKDYLMPLMK